MKMISFATILMTGAALIGCGDADAKAEKAQANKVEAVAAADSEAPQSDAVSPLYKDGINDANRGDKTGMVRVHGTINQPSGGEVTLYETEGRNTIEIAKTRLSNRAFDFGEIEVSRGFYKISLNGETNATDIIFNPDEPDVELTFNSSRLSANKSAAGSKENTGWFAYQSMENTNNSEVRKLRSSIKDAGAFRARIEEQIKQKQAELVDQQHALMDQYPGTYLAKYLGWKNPKYPNNQGRFFEDIDPLGQQRRAFLGHQRPGPKHDAHVQRRDGQRLSRLHRHCQGTL